MDKKAQKKKDRERDVRAKILRRREAIRNKAKETARWDAEEQRQAPKGEPIRNEAVWAERHVLDAERRMQLEHNMKILQALNDEWEQEQAQK